jgi:ferredoxin
MNGISINKQILVNSSVVAFACFICLALAGNALAVPEKGKTSNLVDVQKVEVQVDLEPGQVKKARATCPDGFILSDGSARIDHVDQGTGGLDSPKVLESQSVSKKAWQATVKNSATGRAQAKLFAVCLREKTSGEGHKVTLSAPVKKSSTVPAGTHVVTHSCAAGTVAVDPGHKASKPVEIVRSEPSGNGWKFTVKAGEVTKLETAVRCLSQKLKTAGDPGRRLTFERKGTAVTVAPGEAKVAEVICPVHSKAIVADWDLETGLLSLGNDPRPVSRSYRVLNTGTAPATARLSVLCVGDRSVPNP